MNSSTIEKTKGGYRWYAVVSHGGQERLARHHLERQGFEVYLPMRAPLRANRKAGPRPLFPRYLFVSVDLATPGWRAIYSTIGVHTVMMAGSGESARPKAVPGGVIEAIQAREVDGLVILKPEEKPVPFKKGETVAVRGGPLAGLNAIFMEAVDAKRCHLLVSFMGRDSRTTIDLASLG